MKLLTLNFLTCAVKSCRAAATQSTSLTPASEEQQPSGSSSSSSSFPLHLADIELVSVPLDFNEPFWRGVLPRLDLRAIGGVLGEVGLRMPEEVMRVSERGEAMEGVEAMGNGEERGERGLEGLDEGVLRKLHSLLLETQVQEGWLVCGRCGHKYSVKEGVPNFLLPPHLVG